MPKIVNSATFTIIAPDQTFSSLNFIQVELQNCMNTFNLPRNFACKPSTPCMGVHLHANFQPTWQNWTGTLNYQLCSVNAGEVCKLTFRPDPQFARELAALPPKVCTQTCNRPSQVCMQTCMPAGKSLHANFQSPLASLHATSWKFACKLSLPCAK